MDLNARFDVNCGWKDGQMDAQKDAQKSQMPISHLANLKAGVTKKSVLYQKKYGTENTAFSSVVIFSHSVIGNQNLPVQKTRGPRWP